MELPAAASYGTTTLMVILTNRYNLPAPIVRAVQRDPYDKGDSDLSVTELLSSPRIAHLRRKHDHEIEQDVSDFLWSLLGSGIHQVLERGGRREGLGKYTERRLYLDHRGWRISGGMDFWQDGERVKINDWKFTSAKSVYVPKVGWEQQLNLYALLFEQHYGHPPDALEVIAIIRDWQKEIAEVRPDYPASAMVPVPLRLWTADERWAFLNARLDLHASALAGELFDQEPPLCTDEDRWVRAPKHAVTKKGNKRATAVFDTEDDAQAYILKAAIDKPKDKFLLEFRHGSPHRCLHYCEVAKFCTQFQHEAQTTQQEEPDSAEPE